MAIKNIVFDVGNVLVRWDPAAVVVKVFPDLAEPEVLAQQVFKSQIWMDLNLGKLSEPEAIPIYQKTLNLERELVLTLLQTAKESLLPIAGSFDLLEKFYQARFNLFALTDNTKEIMSFLKDKYKIWHMFKGIVVSAEIGFLKPAREIYMSLLNTHHLIPQETLFLDDLKHNIDGANAVGISGIQFDTTAQCIKELEKLKIFI